MSPSKPKWLRVSYNDAETQAVRALMDHLQLNTVCREANCPNLGKCYKRGTATFMILGSQCTRNCRFCNVVHGKPTPVDPHEPDHIAEAAKTLGLKHVVITSVTRDDLADGGAGVFAAVLQKLRAELPEATLEVLIPDFQGQTEALHTVLKASPDVLNHNVETVPSLYTQIRPGASYQRSLDLLQKAANFAQTHPIPGGRMLVKTGLMLGLGETQEELKTVFRDLVAHGVDILTLGQYLQPTDRHAPVAAYLPPDTFDNYRKLAEAAGISYVAASPLVRSSYLAEEALTRVRKQEKQK